MSTVRIQAPAAWLTVPRSDAEFDRWAEELRGRPGADRVLEEGLARLRHQVVAGSEARTWLAVVPTDGSPRIAAAGWFAVLDMGDDVAEMRARADAAAVPAPFLCLEQRLVDERRRGRDVIGVYRLLTAEPGPLGPRLVEWFAALGHDARTGLTIDFEMSTTDVSVFDDLVAVSTAFLVDLDLRGATR